MDDVAPWLAVNGARRVGVAAGVVLVLAGAGLVGCGGRSESVASRSFGPSAVGPPPNQAALDQAPPNQATPLAAGEATRKVISTANLRVEVGDVTAAADRAGRLAAEAGGFVAGSEETGAPDERRAQVTLKVPEDRFDQLVAALATLGEVRSKQVSTEDVTEQVVDLEARLRASRAAAERLQQLIARAASVAEVVGVEAELARRTAEVESLEGRLRVLRDKIDLATVTVNLSPPGVAADEELPGFVSGLRGGWRALRATAILGSAALGALLPWLVPLAVLVVAARLGWRRWRRSHPPRLPLLPPLVWNEGPGPGPPAAAAPVPAPASGADRPRVPDPPADP